MNDWQMQNQLHGSPYSGCRCFTGWPKAPVVRIPRNTTWPSPYNAPGARLCVDRGRKPVGGVQNVQRAHFRPSAPYPSWVLGPGGDPVKPMPNFCSQVPGKPPYNIARGIRGPGVDALTFAIGQGNSAAGGPDFVVGSAGQVHSGNLGWA